MIRNDHTAIEEFYPTNGVQGKLVPQEPNDEPASVLLERIRAEKQRLIKERKIKKDKNESVIYRVPREGDGSTGNLSYTFYERTVDGRYSKSRR